MDDIRISPQGDPFYAASFARHRDEQESCRCYGGYHYIGHMVEDEHGDEVEVFDAVACRRCRAEDL